MAVAPPPVEYVARLSRAEFLAQHWPANYNVGDHVTCLAPSGGGKTQLSYQLLGPIAKPTLPAVVFVMKPKDKTVTQFTKANGFRIIRDYPPPPAEKIRALQGKPPGWVLWPTETGNPEADDYRHAVIFRRALRTIYTAGGKGKPSIIFGDEVYSLEEELKLGSELRRIWSKGRSNGVGLWAASQRPVAISRWALQAQHLFLGNDPDVDMQRRYGEIGGGIDPALVRATCSQLNRFEFLYINRDERTCAIIEAS